MQIHCATYIIIYAFIIYSYCPFIARNLQVLFDYWLLPFINFLYICIITKRWQFFPCTRSVTPPLLRNLLIWFVLFVMEKLEVYYYYPYIRTPHFSLRLPNKSNLWSPKRGNELLTEFFFFGIGLGKRMMSMMLLMSGWCLLFMVTRTTSPLHVNAFCGIVKFPRTHIKMKTARRAR